MDRRHCAGSMRRVRLDPLRRSVRDHVGSWRYEVLASARTRLLLIPVYAYGSYCPPAYAGQTATAGVSHVQQFLIEGGRAAVPSAGLITRQARRLLHVTQKSSAAQRGRSRSADIKKE